VSLSSYLVSPSIAVSDMSQAQEFYEGKLGLSVVRTGADGTWTMSSGSLTSSAPRV
jgi:hypothetical protein